MMSANTEQVDRAALVSTMREDLIAKMWRGLFVIALIGAPISLSRSLSTGWLPLYTLHAVAAAIVILVFLLRQRLSYKLRVGILIGMFWVIGLGGAFSLGLLGAGLWWLSMSALIISVLVSMRWGVLSVIAMTVVLCLVAYGYVGGTLHLGFDANAYIRAPSSWVTLLVGTCVMPIIVFTAFAGYQRATADLLHKIEEQNVAIQHLATHDYLTGLPTLNLAQEHLEQALAARSRRQRRVALLFIDLDGFKAVNDTYGHEAGDSILRHAGKTMTDLVRQEDIVSRKGGDEFLIILSDLQEAEAALSVANKLIAKLNEPIPYDAEMLHIGASIGVALSRDENEDAKSLTRRADAAMYEAKRKGKNKACLA